MIGDVLSLVLAAGEGRRFGGTKQLAPLRGRPLLEHALDAAAAGPGEGTVVVLGAHAEEIERRIDFTGITIVHCPDWEKGPGASLGAGIAAMGPQVGVALVTLGDEPFVPATAGRRLLAALGPGVSALRATYAGRPGHPVLIERALFSALASPRSGMKPAAILEAAGIEGVECGDLGSPVDVDTPAALAALERRRP